jgi:hypothetical protein
MLTIALLTMYICTLGATIAARLAARLVQAIAFDVASYATTPAPTAGAVLSHYTDRACWRTARTALALADTITTRAQRASERG